MTRDRTQKIKQTNRDRGAAIARKLGLVFMVVYLDAGGYSEPGRASGADGFYGDLHHLLLLAGHCSPPALPGDDLRSDQTFLQLRAKMYIYIYIYIYQ